MRAEGRVIIGFVPSQLRICKFLREIFNCDWKIRVFEVIFFAHFNHYAMLKSTVDLQPC